MMQVHDLTVGYVSGMIAAGLFVGAFSVYASYGGRRKNGFLFP